MRCKSTRLWRDFLNFPHFSRLAEPCMMDPSFCSVGSSSSVSSSRMFYHLPLSVAGKRFYKAENAGALWLEASCGGCYYAGSCGVDGPVFGTGPGPGTYYHFYSDRCRRSGVFPGASGNA